jgi:hypothetical protein
MTEVFNKAKRNRKRVTEHLKRVTWKKIGNKANIPHTRGRKIKMKKEKSVFSKNLLNEDGRVVEQG